MIIVAETLLSPEGAGRTNYDDRKYHFKSEEVKVWDADGRQNNHRFSRFARRENQPTAPPRGRSQCNRDKSRLCVCRTEGPRINWIFHFSSAACWYDDDGYDEVPAVSIELLCRAGSSQCYMQLSCTGRVIFDVASSFIPTQIRRSWMRELHERTYFRGLFP